MTPIIYLFIYLFIFPIFSCCTKSDNQSQEDLAKSKNPLKCWQTTRTMLAKHANFKRAKLDICPNPSKNVAIS